MLINRTDRIRREMDRLAGELIRLMHASPDDFDGREALWMRREALRAQL
jgi:hypothetical protein